MRQWNAAASGAGTASPSAPGAVDRRPRWAVALALLIALLLAGAVAVRGAAVAPVRGPAAVPPNAALGSSASTWAQLSGLAQLAISRGVGAEESSYWPTGAGRQLSARNGAQRLSLRFSAGGVAVSTAAGRVGLSLRSVRGDGRSLPVATAVPTARANRVSYDRGAVTEWYANGPLGLEQGFTVSRADAAAARRSLTLNLDLATSGGLRARAAGGGVELLAGHRVALRYDGLRVVDARGRALPASMRLRGSRVALAVRTAGARFPLTIDPIVQSGTLVAADGAAQDGLGQSVAVSGSLIAVGAQNATVGSQSEAGAVYVFTEPTGGWAAASSAVKLTEATPVANAQLGASVAISGNAVLAGAPMDGAGAVYVFNEPAGGWASENQTGQLTNPDTGVMDEFGYSMAASGSTVAVGSPLAQGYAGEIDVYNEPAGGWATEGPVATLKSDAAGASAVGWSVAMDGSTIVSGAPLSNSFAGAVDLYSEPAGGWASANETALLNSSDGVFGTALGSSVGIYGNTVVAGAPGATVGANMAQGALYVYDRPASGQWVAANESAKLTAANGAASDALGTSVAITGSTILAGAPAATVGANANQGAFYEFDASSAGGWSSGAGGTELSESGGAAGDDFGHSLALSGLTLAVGADAATVGANASQGSATVFTLSANLAAGGGAGGGGAKGTTGPSGPGAPGGSTTRNYATVISVSGGPGHATVSLKCFITAGKCVAANAELVVEEKLQGKKVVATQAKAKAKAKPKFTYKRIVIGKAHVTLTARQHANLVVSLNAAGHAIFGAHTKLSVGLSVASTGRTLRQALVTITKPVPAKKPAAKKKK